MTRNPIRRPAETPSKFTLTPRPRHRVFSPTAARPCPRGEVSDPPARSSSLSMDRTLATVSFRHPSLAGPGPVEVRQDLGGFDGVDGTARWAGPPPRAAEWLCDRGPEIGEARRARRGHGHARNRRRASGAASVVLTDAPSELALLRHNAQRANETRRDVRDLGGALAWGDSRAIADLAPFDVVLCSDVLYQNPPEA